MREHGALHLYSLMGGSDVAEVPGPDVLFRMVALRGWWLNVWLASLSQAQLHAALQARGPAHALHVTIEPQYQMPSVGCQTLQWQLLHSAAAAHEYKAPVSLQTCMPITSRGA